MVCNLLFLNHSPESSFFNSPMNSLRSCRIFGDASITIAQWRGARDLTDFGYPQIPGSIPAENPSTHINIDLSKQTLKQGFKTTVSSNKSQFKKNGLMELE